MTDEDKEQELFDKIKYPPATTVDEIIESIVRKIQYMQSKSTIIEIDSMKSKDDSND